MRLWPKSLLGQMLLAVALALLVAQAISATLLYRASENRREQIALNAAAFRLVAPGNERAQNGQNTDERESRRMRRQANRQRDGRLRERRLRAAQGQPPRAFRLESSPVTPLLDGEITEPRLEQQLEAILAGQGIAADDLVVIRREAKTDEFIRSNPRLLKRLADGNAMDSDLIVVGLRSPGEQQWRVARVLFPHPQKGAMQTIIAQTLLIYLLLVGLHFLLLRRITKPLAALTKRTEDFGHGISSGTPLPPEGPEDVRRLISAHNAMQSRIAALLDEKDVMLGAIGHDLKTPLAALRVRIESVENENERGKMAESIEDITQSLDDILSLARVGKSAEPAEKAQLGALVMSVAEEFEDMGQPVAAGHIEKITHPVYVTWLKRGLRNLVGNAVRYGGGAEIALLRDGDTITIRVDDNGPGIPENQIAAMLEPFTRGEASRNRDTGGAGLGLTLARAIAEQHGGTLVLANREEGGLRAEIRLPISGHSAV
ncbi:hypothetical protein GCM10023115_06840 [Pontixanthobacter gangjinensis]|uniref:histidine kinase n=1 Tax=Pontixanthobacter gangjinensis TaxID=1028742 RepID=A0A6I4SMF3_9SPHN|nr:ATP-binding protein [Pontixanthobacter gangjinensis]MXO55932.1 two-component sensor histidine kinase [Pontixanthobacter gangjinensis]